MSKVLVFCIDALCACDIPYMEKMPHFGPFLKRAALVEKIRPVWPALTYCCHTSILTGCYVERHGIVHNENMHRGGHLGEPWFSMKRDVKVPTLLDRAREKGLTTCSLSWPVSGGADYDMNLPMIVPYGYTGYEPEQYLRHTATPALLDRYFYKHGRYLKGPDRSLDLFTMASALDILEDYRAVYDIIFLDVEMKHLDGMTTAERIRQMDADVILIFITNMAQYAIRGYSVGALDYVLKPVPYFAFSQQLLKAVARLEKRAKHYLTVPVEGGLRRLDTASIYYLESEGHRVHFYTDEGDFSAPGALKAFEEKLADCPFARCNSGYLVNLAQVRELRQSTVQVGPCELQVSRPKRKAFLAALTDYIGGEGS